MFDLLLTLTNTVNGVERDQYTYTYDGAHNQLTKLETINQSLKGTTSYRYDSLNRLTEVIEPKKSTESTGKVTAYTYDAAGNRETEKVTVSGSSETSVSSVSLITYQYNEQNRLLSTSQEQSDGTKKTTTYCYDNNGNLTKKNLEQTRKIDPSNPPTASFGMFIEGQPEATSENAKDIVNGIASYEYDVWNQMVKAITGGGTSTYQYNGEGYRTERTENGITTRSLYEADKVILETDKKGKQIARNVYGTNLLVRTAGEDTFYYMYNGHGDVTGLIDANGKTRATYYYDAFGNPDVTGTKYYDANGNVVKEAVNNTITYAGYQYDSATELYYLNARMYDSKIARFMSEDTYLGQANDPLSLNLYTYCANNPITYTDPTGHRMKGDEELLNNDGLKEIDKLASEWWTYENLAKKAIASGYIDSYKNYKVLMAKVKKDANDVRSSQEYLKSTDVVDSKDKDIFALAEEKVNDYKTNYINEYNSYNFTYGEALFINQIIANGGSNNSLKQLTGLLYTLENNRGNISKKEVEKILSQEVAVDTPAILEFFYKFSMEDMTVAEVEYEACVKRLQEAFGFTASQAANAFSGQGTNLENPYSTYQGIPDIADEGASNASKSLLQAGSKADALKSIDNLPSEIQSSVKSFYKGGSNAYNNFSVTQTANGSYLVEMTKPGNVPGSYAVYYKEIAANGTTIKVYKNTFDPAGNLVHTKDK